jgi:glyoxylase I family protein
MYPRKPESRSSATFIAQNIDLHASQNPDCAGIVVRFALLLEGNQMLFQRRQLLRVLSFTFGSNFILSRNQFGLAQPNTPPTSALPSTGAAVGHGLAGGTEMEKVTGIGGFFFRAKDPKALASWYEQHLGISLTPSSPGGSPWQQEAGPTAFAPFKETSDYFGDPQKVWMLNFRVRDLDKMAAQLQAAGIEIKIDPQSYPIGRFARIHDPEGNPIELWQPATPPASH